MNRAFVPAFVFSLMAGIVQPATSVTAQVATAPAAPVQAAPVQAAPVQAAPVQMVCGKRTDMVRQLGEKYGETRQSMGVARGRGVIELYASEETGSWTILLTSPQGIACLMAAGEAFQSDPVEAAGDPI